MEGLEANSVSEEGQEYCGVFSATGYPLYTIGIRVFKMFQIIFMQKYEWL